MKGLQSNGFLPIIAQDIAEIIVDSVMSSFSPMPGRRTSLLAWFMPFSTWASRALFLPTI